MPDRKLDKNTLARIFMRAKDKYIDVGHCDGSLYLSAHEILTRAYVEAALDVLESQGYTLVKKDDVTKV